jgi:hypothetical protein
MSMLELAERVEAATEPDSELDGSVWWAALSPDTVQHLDRTGYVRETIERYGSAGKALAQFMDSSNPGCLAKIAFDQAYTRSIDAAHSLVPEGWFMELEQHSTSWTATLANRLWYDDTRVIHDASAATPALALTAAALRARHALALSKGLEG